MCLIEVGDVVIFAPKKNDRRMGNRVGVVKSKAKENILIIVTDCGELLRIPTKRCMVIYTH